MAPMKVAVIGAGIVGVVLRVRSRVLARVVVHEQHTALSHAWQYSPWHPRIVRRAYADPFYTAVMGEAYPLWAELEKDTSTTLIELWGSSTLARRTSTDGGDAHHGLEEKTPLRIAFSRARCREVSRHGAWDE